MASNKFPVTTVSGMAPSANSFPKKSIKDGWGATNEAANAPNTPSMSTFKGKSSVGQYADYCDVPADQDPYHEESD